MKKFIILVSFITVVLISLTIEPSAIKKIKVFRKGFQGITLFTKRVFPDWQSQNIYIPNYPEKNLLYAAVIEPPPFPPCTDTKENCQPTKVKIASPKKGSTVRGIVEIVPEVINPILPIEKYEVEYYIDYKIKMKAFVIEPPYKWDTTKYTNGKHILTINVCNRTGTVGHYSMPVYVKN